MGDLLGPHRVQAKPSSYGDLRAKSKETIGGGIVAEVEDEWGLIGGGTVVETEDEWGLIGGGTVAEVETEWGLIGTAVGFGRGHSPPGAPGASALFAHPCV
jgi:hypothetical protein